MSTALAAPLRAAPRAPITPQPAPTAERGEVAFELAMRHAGTRRVVLRYEISGAASAPLLLVAGGISAHRHVRANACDETAGWWESQSGEGAFLHPERSRVIGFEWLGADGTLDAVIDPADQADAFALALDALGIARVDAFVGAQCAQIPGSGVDLDGFHRDSVPCSMHEGCGVRSRWIHRDQGRRHADARGRGTRPRTA